MYIEKDITDDEMVATFLKGEIDSTSFGLCIRDGLEQDKKNREIVDEPNFLDTEENGYRKYLLGKCRGYGRNTFLFNNFPADIQWKRVILDKTDLSKVKYINCSNWSQWTGNSRLPLDGAKHSELINQCKELVETLKRGEKFFEIILVASNINDTPIILDGNHRMTAYFIEPQHAPEELRCIIGFSEKLNNWTFY